MSKKVLGRGLGAYFNELDQDQAALDPKQLQSLDPRERINVIVNIPVRNIRPNPHQPRADFDEFRLQELSESIRMHGLIQPITVRYIGDDRYELISGERRLRASKMAGVDVIPSYVREANDEEIITFALIENLQREQLNPIEVAVGYQRLQEECNLTQEEVAGRVGKNRTTVTNMLRLLGLPAFIQAALKKGTISMGHARALVSIDNERLQEQLLDKILSHDLSVRQVEEAVKTLADKRINKNKVLSKKDQIDLEYLRLANLLRNRLSTKVAIKKKLQGGEIRIEYYSDEDLERILNLFESIQ